MKFPEIPTDNLYKFMAISGIVLLIASYLPYYHAYKMQVDLISLIGEHEIMGLEEKWASEQLDVLKHKADTLASQMSALMGMPASEIIKALSDGRSLSEVSKNKHIDLEKYQMKWEELDTKVLDLTKLMKEQLIKETKIGTNIAVYKCHRKMITWGKRLTLISAFVGGFLAMFGFGRWYTKLQVLQDLIIKQKVKGDQKQ